LTWNLGKLIKWSGVLALLLAAGCCQTVKKPSADKPRRDINAVLGDHDKELMLIPGVVGVYVGEFRNQPCLKVMLARKDRQVKSRIPRELEGYPVITEVTGEIQPFK
jgi:hypothetical protein